LSVPLSVTDTPCASPFRSSTRELISQTTGSPAWTKVVVTTRLTIRKPNLMLLTRVFDVNIYFQPLPLKRINCRRTVHPRTSPLPRPKPRESSIGHQQKPLAHNLLC